MLTAVRCLKMSRIGRTLCLQCADISKVLYMPHHVGRCCNVTRGHWCFLGHSCNDVIPCRCISSPSCSNVFRGHCCVLNNSCTDVNPCHCCILSQSYTDTIRGDCSASVPTKELLVPLLRKLRQADMDRTIRSSAHALKREGRLKMLGANTCDRNLDF